MEKDHRIRYKIQKATDYIAQQKHLHALQVYEKILNEHPDNQEAICKTAELFEFMGFPEKGERLLSSSLEEMPDNKELRMFVGQFLLRNEKWESAIDVLNYLPVDEEPLVIFFIGYSHYMLNEFELAKINLKNFIASSEKDELFYEANLYLAKTELKLGDLKSALSYAKKADVVYNNFWEMHAVYAEIYLNMGMHAHAIAPIEKAIKLNKYEPKVYELAGKIYFGHGDYAKAEKNFRKLIDVSEDISSSAYIHLAEACIKTNNIKDAHAFYDMALKIDPENKKAVEGINNLTEKLNESAAGDA